MVFSIIWVAAVVVFGEKMWLLDSSFPGGSDAYWEANISVWYMYQDSDSITQSELMRMMNDNSKDEEIQVGNYLSYILTDSVHGPRHA